MTQRFSRQRSAWTARIGGTALAVAATLGLAACGSSQAPDCGGLTVDNPWVRAAPEGADVMGAYFSLANDGEDEVVLNGVSSTQFDRAELHETVVNDDGQASMQPIEKLTVPAGERIVFKPGGRHVMLFSPSQPYAAGDQVELILSCGTQNAELPVAAPVRAAQPGVPGDAAAESTASHEQTMDDDMKAAEGAADDSNTAQ